MPIHTTFTPEALRAGKWKCGVNGHGSTSRVLECNVFCHYKGLGRLGRQYYSHTTPQFTAFPGYVEVPTYVT